MAIFPVWHCLDPPAAALLAQRKYEEACPVWRLDEALTTHLKVRHVVQQKILV